ncbi:MAG TPA: D-alanyl-D-alanine carboxypeptidase/D-alanyl-D-alanine-endopeptidase [Thermoanaerobaculia bacterium]|nr:D-alanyl-D-alanine carboxypeptidase/D-alanyl-D-alanine-endopeptidase [Thermoanaerobaculia bacterium]
MRSRTTTDRLATRLAVCLVTGLAAVAPAAWANGLDGIFAVRGLEGLEVLEAENAERLFTPASVQKLIVGAAVFHYLGPDYRVATHVATAGELLPIEEGGYRLTGDLVVEGACDPTWGRRHNPQDARAPLRQIARDLAALGLRRVEGDLVVDASRFPGRRYPDGWPEGDAAFSWGAAPSALAIDENVVGVSVAAGGALGQPARIDGAADVEWINQTVTVGRERHGRGSLEFQPIWGQPRVVVRGEYPISEPAFGVRLASPDPEGRAGIALRQALERAGIEVLGEVRVAQRPPPGKLERLATYTSPPVRDMVVVMLRNSHNFYAESLLRILAAARVGDGRLDRGLDLESEFLRYVVGIDRVDFELDDASGLSPFNLISPRATVALLRWVYQQPWRDAYLTALASGSGGTLVGWGRLPPMVGKTGTIRHTQALAGVLTPADGVPVFFAVFLNHRTQSRPQLRGEIVRALWRWHRGTAAPGLSSALAAPTGVER